MKKDIHPTYYHDTKVTCACGNTFTTGSILKKISVPICSQCHPFWTREQKFVDTEGRVEKFERKRKTARKGTVKIAKEKKIEKIRKKEAMPLTLREMLQKAK